MMIKEEKDNLVEWYKKRFPNYSKADLEHFIDVISKQEDSPYV